MDSLWPFSIGVDVSVGVIESIGVGVEALGVEEGLGMDFAGVGVDGSDGVWGEESSDQGLQVSGSEIEEAGFLVFWHSGESEVVLLGLGDEMFFSEGFIFCPPDDGSGGIGHGQGGSGGVVVVEGFGMRFHADYQFAVGIGIFLQGAAVGVCF